MLLAAKLARWGDRLLTLAAALLLGALALFGAWSLWDIAATRRAALPEQTLRFKPLDAAPADSPGFAELRALNPDVCGWLTLDGTRIDFPVVQGADNMVYVNTDVYGDFSLSGAIFLDSRCPADFTAPYSIVYGHHIEDGRMFGDIVQFTQSDYFAAHTTGTLITDDTSYNIALFACVRADAYEPEATPDPAAEEAAQRAKYADLIARNPEFAGWIEIPGVDIDLPILQTTDNYFYLYHDLDRADDKRGMPFADYECDMKDGRHLIIYGHNMGVNNTDRFSNLQKYRDADYYTAHPYLKLDTLYKSEIYKIVAVYAVTSRESDGDVFHFNQYIDLDDAAEQTFLDEVAKRAFYTTGDYAYPTERLLTLSTCTYQMDDARMVILARPLRDGETTEADTVHINSDPLLPARWPAGK